MTTITLPYRTQLTQGQPEVVDYVLQDMDAILDVVNGDLDNGNINVAAAIAVSKLGITGTPGGGKFVKDDFSWQFMISGNAAPLVDTILGTAAASFDLQAIPQTYKHLFIAAYLRGTQGGSNQDDLNIRFNNDTGSNYDSYSIDIASTSATRGATERLASDHMQFQNTMPGGAAVANSFGPLQLWIPNYADAANNKAWVGEASNTALQSAGKLFVCRGAGFWRSNNAINRITLYCNSGSDFAVGSRLTLIGVN